MPSQKIYLEKQNHLIVCTLEPNHRWFWTACYEGVKPLIGEMSDGDMVSVRLTVDEIEYLGNMGDNHD